MAIPNQPDPVAGIFVIEHLPSKQCLVYKSQDMRHASNTLMRHLRQQRGNMKLQLLYNENEESLQVRVLEYTAIPELQARLDHHKAQFKEQKLLIKNMGHPRRRHVEGEVVISRRRATFLST